MPLVAVAYAQLLTTVAPRVAVVAAPLLLTTVAPLVVAVVALLATIVAPLVTALTTLVFPVAVARFATSAAQFVSGAELGVVDDATPDHWLLLVA